MKNSRPLNDRRLSFDVCRLLLEEATFRGQILEEEGLEARFLCSSLIMEARFSKESSGIVLKCRFPSKYSCGFISDAITI
jgi:hypothetical protein